MSCLVPASVTSRHMSTSPLSNVPPLTGVPISLVSLCLSPTLARVRALAPIFLSLSLSPLLLLRRSISHIYIILALSRSCFLSLPLFICFSLSLFLSLSLPRCYSSVVNGLCLSRLVCGFNVCRHSCCVSRARCRSPSLSVLVCPLVSFESKRKEGM